MFAPLLLALQTGGPAPELTLLTPPQAGTTLVYSLEGNLANPPQVPEVRLIDFTLLPLPIPVQPFGTLHLALTPLLQVIFGTGTHLFSVPVPPNPNLAGLVVHAQGFGFVFNGQSGVQKLSNLVSTTLTAPAPRPRFVFVANGGDSTISQFLVQESNGKLRQSRISLLERAPIDLVARPGGTRLYILTASTLDRFIVDTTSGALTPIGSPVMLPAGTAGVELALSPAGNRLYALDGANDRVLGWNIGPDDTFTALPGSPWSVGGSGAGTQACSSFALDAQGRFLAVANELTDTLSVFEVQVDGSLANERTAATSAEPSAVTLLYQDLAEPVALVATRGADGVAAYQLAPDGTPSLVGQAQLAGGADPVAVRAGRFESGDRVYVTNEGTGTVDVLLLTAQGQLSVPSPSLFGDAALDLALAPEIDRAFALFAGDGELSTASLAPDTGALAPVAPLESPTDRNRVRLDPRAIAIVDGVDFGALVTDSAYVVAHVGREVDQYEFDEDLGTLSPHVPPSTGTAGQPNEAVVHPTLGLLFVSNLLQSGGADLEVFGLTAKGLASPSQALDLDAPGTSPIWGVDVDPTGSLVLATVASVPGTVVPLRVAAGGQLEPLPGVLAGDVPRGGALDPTGRFYYVANSLGASVSQYRVDAANHGLTPLAPATVAAGTGAVDVVCDPNGRFAWVSNSVAGTVSAYTIDHATGRLTPLGPPFATGGRPATLAVDPGGRYLVVADETQFVLHRLRINLAPGDGVPDGSLVSVGQTPITVPPRGLRFTADGHSLLVSIDNPSGPDNLVTYAFDPTVGTLSVVDVESPASQPRGIATRDRVQ